jgi:transposase
MTATLTAPTYHLFVGVDIAAASFAASWTQGGLLRECAQTFAQPPDGYRAFQTALTQTGVTPGATLLVLEATGSYWITLYAGLVPLAHESGASVRGRASIGHSGHARLRTALYLASLTAARFNPVIRAQYERLRAAGKPAKVARCAAARKLLHLAYAVVTKKRAFDPNHREAKVGPVAQAA